MTRPFKVSYTCSNCGAQTTAESGFGRWMRNNAELDSKEGIVRTDFDHTICRYKTYYESRGFQIMMIVEVKEHGAEPDESQTDLLSFTNQILFKNKRGKNMYNARTAVTHKLWSKKNQCWVNVRHYGVHLLQFEKTNPDDSAWIKWDRKIITKEVLVDLLRMDRRPDNPDLFMIEYLRDRHKKDSQTKLVLA